MSQQRNIRIHGEKFEDLITRRGRNVLWREALLCSCWNMDSQQPLYSCKACGGKGRIYNPPIECRVLLTSITQSAEFEETAGMFQIGDAIMTVPKRIRKPLGNGTFSAREWVEVPAYNVGMYDIITVLDDEYKSSEILIRGEPIYGRPADTLLNDYVTNIQLVWKSDPETGTITKYQKDVDFVNEDNKIVWLEGGNSPEIGESYSVVYHHRPSFIVLATLPRPRYQDGQLLPRYVALRYRAGGFEPK